jgi:hypothetical protein
MAHLLIFILFVVFLFFIFSFVDCLGGKVHLSPRLTQYLSDNMDFVKDMAAQNSNTDPFWHQVSGILSQDEILLFF